VRGRTQERGHHGSHLLIWERLLPPTKGLEDVGPLSPNSSSRMRTLRLIQRSLSYYWPTHLAVILGVAIAVAVLSGALIVGNSVRSSLRELLVDRLGNADYVISGSYYREHLANDLESASQFAARFDATCPLITMEGLVIHQENKRRASAVLVYGVDDRFWRFHGQSRVGIKERETLLSPA